MVTNITEELKVSRSKNGIVFCGNMNYIKAYTNYLVEIYKGNTKIIDILQKDNSVIKFYDSKEYNN